jgi:hypothetical protein
MTLLLESLESLESESLRFYKLIAGFVYDIEEAYPMISPH